MGAHSARLGTASQWMAIDAIGTTRWRLYVLKNWLCLARIKGEARLPNVKGKNCGSLLMDDIDVVAIERCHFRI